MKTMVHPLRSLVLGALLATGVGASGPALADDRGQHSAGQVPRSELPADAQRQIRAALQRAAMHIGLALRDLQAAHSLKPHPDAAQGIAKLSALQNRMLELSYLSEWSRVVLSAECQKIYSLIRYFHPIQVAYYLNLSGQLTEARKQCLLALTFF